MAALLRRNAILRLQGSLARLGSTASSTQQALVIPAEVALLVSQRGPGLAVMPPDVVAAVDQAAADANRKAVKRRGQELSYRLRHMSRSKHRGGVHPNLSQQAAAGEEDEAATAARRRSRGKRRQSRHQVLEQLTRSAALPVDVEARKAPGLAQLLAPLQDVVNAEEAAQAAAERQALAARSSIADGGSLYDAPAALAYAASRMPACYAALEAALGEVAARRPGWRPAGMLDFGAGPATAVWAAQQVWRQQPLDALAVEPAAAMSWLGHEIQQRQHKQYEAAVQQAATAAHDAAGGSSEGGLHEQQLGPAGPAEAAVPAAAGREEEDAEGLSAPPPRLRWMHKLPPRYRAAQGRRYDLVTAGYVLGELRGDAERRRLVEELWERTAAGGVLVLVEPGTPSGAAHIQRARTQLLKAAARRRQQQQQQAEGAPPEAAAHVVAPCPHDGVCPLETRTSWCHFVQRFQRTQLQRNAKAAAGIQPRTYQDERYSYVALAKAPRPAAHEEAAQPMVAGAFMPDLSDPQDALVLPERLAPRKVQADAVPIKLYDESGVEEDEESDDWWAEEGEEEGEDAEGRSSNDEDSSSSSSSSEDSSSSSDSSSESSSESDTEAEGEGEEEVRLEELPGTSHTTPLLKQRLAAGLAAAAGRQQLEGVDEATRRLLLESVLQGGDDDDDDGAGAELAVRLQHELAAAAAHRRQAAVEAGASRGADSGRAAAPVLAPVSEATADLLMAGESVDWARQEPEAVAAALRASGGWSRVIRTPRKRSGHVVLDICSAAAVQAAPGDGSGAGGVQQQQQQQQQQPQQAGGVLLRQVVSKAAAQRDAGGTAAYRLARRMRWGDLWPQHYQQRFRAEEAPAGSSV